MTVRILKSLFQRFTRPAATALEDIGILVVDDEDAVLEYAKRVLNEAGYRPLVASSAEEAIVMAQTMPRLDLLMTDLIMPSMKGDELSRQLRSKDPDLKVLYQTGFTDRLFADKILLWAGDAFIEKPYSMGALTQAVSRLLRDQECGAESAAATGMTAVWTADL